MRSSIVSIVPHSRLPAPVNGPRIRRRRKCARTNQSNQCAPLIAPRGCAKLPCLLIMRDEGLIEDEVTGFLGRARYWASAPARSQRSFTGATMPGNSGVCSPSSPRQCRLEVAQRQPLQAPLRKNSWSATAIWASGRRSARCTRKRMTVVEC